VGCVRERNEDAIVSIPEHGVFAVCDGCGGKAGGQQASSIAARFISEEGSRLTQTFSDYRTEKDRELRTQILQQIARIFDEACQEIYAQSNVNAELRGMATTAVMLTIMDSSGFIGHVGDSRIYLIRRDKIYQLTEDHSFFQRLVNAGKLKPEDYDGFPYKHIISRSVGSEPTVETDTLFVDLLPNDIYLLCSDGISDLVKPVEMLSIAHYDGPEALVSKVVDLALSRGGIDNASAVVIHISEQMDSETRSIDFTARLALFAEIDLFRLLSDQELARILRIVYEEHYEAGQCIIQEGTRGDCFYVVAEGQVVVSLKGVPLTVTGPGSHLGELSLVDEAPRSASAHAQTKVTVLRIRKEDFYRLTQQDPAMATKLLWVFLEGTAKRVRELSDRLSSMR
jgi:serine/threonine protein phosphatase PrpC